MDSKKLALMCRELAENRKAEDVVVLDVRKLSSVTDYFVIATGSSEPHLRAVESEITGRLADEHGIRVKHLDGTAKQNWVVVDYFDVIVHIMRAEVREKYDLEGLWGDAVAVKVAHRGPPTADTMAKPSPKSAVRSPVKGRAKARAKTKTKAKPKTVAADSTGE